MNSTRWNDCGVSIPKFCIEISIRGQDSAGPTNTLFWKKKEFIYMYLYVYKYDESSTSDELNSYF